MKKHLKSLTLNRETLRSLERKTMAGVAGGATQHTLCTCNPTFQTCTCTDEITTCAGC